MGIVVVGTLLRAEGVIQIDTIITVINIIKEDIEVEVAFSVLKVSLARVASLAANL